MGYGQVRGYVVRNLGAALGFAARLLQGEGQGDGLPPSDTKETTQGNGDAMGLISQYVDVNSGPFLVACGVLLAILASFLTCLGLGLQKVSICAPENSNISMWKQPKWVVGFVCMVVGNIIDFLAFGLAPQSLLAPLGALSLVWNLFMSSFLLDEQYNRNDIGAVILIFIGTGITVIYSNHTEKSYSLQELRDLYYKPRMYAYFFFVPALLALHYAMLDQPPKKNLRGTFWKLVELVGWCGFAGITGGQSILFAKSTVELLKDASHGDDVFLHLDTYIIIAMMTICLFTQISFINGAMKRFDQLYVMPIYQSYWILSGVVGGLVYFGEWEDFTPFQINMFIFGTLITFVGLYVLTKKENHNLNSTGPQPGFDVLPSRRISTDSFGLAANDEFGIEMDPDIYSPSRRTLQRTPSSEDEARRRSTSSMAV
mmetsp:Transcript_12156/g.19759  ORF Transcript_12156/g.19759 Transcript_12156/m.19759 type:complete len:428 (-) Transcript_12156:85-1368(-)